MKHCKAGLLAVLIVLTVVLSSCLHLQQIGSGETEAPETGGPKTEASGTEIPGSKTSGTESSGTVSSGTETPVISDPAGKPGVSDPAGKPDTPEPEESVVDFTLEELVQQNLISSLLGRHKSVTRVTTGSDYVQTGSYWMRDGSPVFYSTVEYDGKVYEDIDYRCFSFMRTSEAETPVGTVYASRDLSDAGRRLDDLITVSLPMELTEEIRIIGQDEAARTVLLKGPVRIAETGSADAEVTLILGRGSLEIRGMHVEYRHLGFDNVYDFEIRYDEEEMGADMMTAWDDTREITFDIRMGSAEGRTETAAYPSSWELKIEANPETATVISVPGAEKQDRAFLCLPGKDAVTVYVRENDADLPPEEIAPDALPFTLDELKAANRSDALLAKYGSYSVQRTEYDNSEICFRIGNTPTYFSFPGAPGDEAVRGSGAYGSDYIEMTMDGGFLFCGYSPEDIAGSSFVTGWDTALRVDLAGGQIREAARMGDSIRFRYVYDYDPTGGAFLEVMLDAGTLEISSITDAGGENAKLYYQYGASSPAGEKLTAAFSGKMRTILCHYEGGDRTFVLPADWAFTVDHWGLSKTCYLDAAMTQAMAVIPGDGADYEIWAGPLKEELPGVPDPVREVPDSYYGKWYEDGGPTEITIAGEGRFSLELGGDVYEGTLCWTDEENGLWASGPRFEIVLDDGSVLFRDAHVTEKDGKLTFAYGGGAQLFRKGSVIRADKIEGEAPANALTFTADKGEYAAQVLLHADVPVREFTFFSLKQEYTPEGEPFGFSSVDLYKLATMEPDKPLAVTVSFGEFTPLYGFSYREDNGEYRSFGLTESGMDGSVIVSEIETAKG